MVDGSNAYKHKGTSPIAEKGGQRRKQRGNVRGDLMIFVRGISTMDMICVTNSGIVAGYGRLILPGDVFAVPGTPICAGVIRRRGLIAIVGIVRVQ